MNPEYKEKWLTALRSGEYEQGTFMLKAGSACPSYCCLGVLIEVVDPEIFRMDEEGGGPHEGCELGEILQTKFGISSEQETILIEMNDGYQFNEEIYPGRRFPEIADWIEENL